MMLFVGKAPSLDLFPCWKVRGGRGETWSFWKKCCQTGERKYVFGQSEEDASLEVRQFGIPKDIGTTHE